jgi:restriction system protein
MPIPDYQSAMLPLLRLAADGAEHRLRDAIDQLATEFAVTPEERVQMLPSGTAPVFNSRVAWARTYLKQAGLLEAPRRGSFRITDAGRKLLTKKPKAITGRLLEQYPAFREFQARSKANTAAPALVAEPITSTPEDRLEAAYQELRAAVESELLDLVKGATPAFFERLVLELLVRMGYGGSRKEAAKAVGQTGDGGIDGIIVQDRLGLDVIYVQAKRWGSAVVGRPDVQRFAGALQGQRARKGVFLTTSTFSKDARDYATSIDSRIILIDGKRLTELMVEFNVGVSGGATYEVKRVDSDFFAEA